MNGKLVDIARFLDNPFAAHVARGILESHDIPCFLMDQNMAAQWSYTGTGGMRLMVMDEDHDRALEILKKSEDIEIESL